MINIYPSAAYDALAESTIKNVPMIGNAGICADSLCTTGRAGINFYCSLSPVAKVFFGARAFNRLGKYSLQMGNVANGKVTSATEIAELMS